MSESKSSAPVLHMDDLQLATLLQLAALKFLVQCSQPLRIFTPFQPLCQPAIGLLTTLTSGVPASLAGPMSSTMERCNRNIHMEAKELVAVHVGVAELC